MIAAKLEVFGIKDYAPQNYEETAKWLRETADFILENKGEFAQNFTARRFFKTEGKEGDETYYEFPDGTTRIERQFPSTYSRDPFPPRG